MNIYFTIFDNLEKVNRFLDKYSFTKMTTEKNRRSELSDVS